jgi:hypothetical protein
LIDLHALMNLKLFLVLTLSLVPFLVEVKIICPHNPIGSRKYLRKT